MTDYEEQTPAARTQEPPEQEQPPEPPCRCARCGAALLGNFCNLCGLAAGELPPVYGGPAYAAYQAPAPPPKRHNSVGIVIAVCCGIAVLVFAVILTLLLVGSYARYAVPSAAVPPVPPYEDYHSDFDAGYSNETATLRVDALGTTRSPGTEEEPAPAGKEYLIVSLRVSNLSQDIIRYDSGDFELCNGMGNLVPPQYLALNAATALGYGRLLPNGMAEGTVVFLIPQGELNLTLYLSDYDNDGILHFPLI